MSDEATPPSGRFRSLDGLRGLAALVVVLHHSLLTIPALAIAYYELDKARATSTGIDFALIYSPLHLIWAGTEAVYLFFVLSGFALALPVLRAARRYAWPAYYAKRGVRLYGPIWLAVGVGAVIVTLTHRHYLTGLGDWINHRPLGYTPKGIMMDLTLFNGNSRVISPLWSLQWELWFSVLLPLFVVLLAVRPRLQAFFWLKIVVLFAIITVSTFFLDHWWLAAQYLPMFGLGVVIAVERERLSRALEGIFRSTVRGCLWSAVALLLAVGTWLLIGLGMSPARAAHFEALEVLGTAMLVIAALYWRPFSVLLSRRIPQWLGKISFSLYLVHEPIVIAARYIVIDHAAWRGLFIGIPASLLAGWLFWWLVERHFHTLARRVGRALSEAERRPVTAP